jgi:hypothetical protein
MSTFKLFLTAVILLVSIGFVIGQTDRAPDTKLNVPGDYGITPMEKSQIREIQKPNPVPQELINQYLNAKKTGNNDEKLRLGKEIDKYLNVIPGIPNLSIQQPIVKTNLPFENDWGIGDVPVYVGNVASSGGWRQLDMKMGEDGNLYICVNRVTSGYNGYLMVYRSSDGGAHWSGVNGATSTGNYWGQVTMLVEKRHATNDDSTRILVYFTSSSALSMNDASLALVSFRRDGSAWYALTAATPASGNKFQYPSACSDGMYYSTATYMHVVVQEVTNANAHVALRHLRSVDWGLSHTSGTISTGYDDFYPSAAFSREIVTSSDSVYAAVERRLSTSQYGLRLLVMPEIPSNIVSTYYLAAFSNVKYEKPCITIQQEYSSTPRKILVTSTKDTAVVGKVAKYHTSTNSGSTWSIDWALGYSTQLSDFTWCNSDSNNAGGGYFIATYVDLDGDSVSVRRGIIGNMGTVLFKRNARAASGILPPVVAVYRVGTTKYSAFAYAGFGPLSVFFNQENLPAVGIEPIGGLVPKVYELYQNYPNPFNPATTIKFDLPKAGLVTLKIYDILGNEVAVLLNEVKSAGSYICNYNAGTLSSGIYFAKLESTGFTSVKKMMLVK